MSRRERILPDVGPADFPFGRALLEAYRRGEDDELMEPFVLEEADGTRPGRITKGDSAIFYNIRGEREIELTSSLTEPGFPHFPTPGDLDLNFSTMIRYDPGLEVAVAFPPESEIAETLAEVISKAGKKQVKISESEKEVHVNFFFSGKRHGVFPGESRVVVDSPEAHNYADFPKMSASGVTGRLLEALEKESLSFIMANYANVDVVGHIEDRGAILQAVGAVDRELGRVVDEARKAGVTVVITADHGTVEKWYYPDGAVDTGHTDSPVPFMVIPPEGKEKIPLSEGGSLIDVAPTVLSLLGLAVPGMMTGRPLIPDSAAGSGERLLMIILDGWGLGDGSSTDLISQAETPAWDRLLEEFPTAPLEASGEAVGLPAGTVGNSEAGHLHLGAGRVVYSDRVRINRALEDGSFFRNEAFLKAVRGARDKGAALHLVGIVSFFSSHGSLDHLLALMDLAAEEGVKEVYIHSFLGRRGERPESGAIYMAKVEAYAEKIGLGRVVSCIGRFWALDREENWDRVEKTYRLLVHGEGRPVRAGIE